LPIAFLHPLEFLDDPLADLVDVFGRHVALGLGRRLPVHFEQPECEPVGIFRHPLFAAVAPRDHFLCAVEGALEQHQLEP
jgi:hypothetical protein